MKSPNSQPVDRPLNYTVHLSTDKLEKPAFPLHPHAPRTLLIVPTQAITQHPFPCAPSASAFFAAGAAAAFASAGAGAAATGASALGASTSLAASGSVARAVVVGATSAALPVPSTS